MQPGENTTIGVAYIFGQDFNDMLLNYASAKLKYSLNYSEQGLPITVTSPSDKSVYTSGSINIQWSIDPLDGDSTIALYYSNSPDGMWKLIASGVQNNGSYNWDISPLRDGILYRVHIVNSKNDTISYNHSSGYFTINHVGDAPPEVVLHKMISVLQNIYRIEWIAGDADGDPLSVKVSYSENNGISYQQLLENTTLNYFDFDTRKYQNTSQGKIKIDVSANGKSAYAESNTFSISNDFLAITDPNSLHHVAGKATGKIFPGIIDESALTGHQYKITFDTLSGRKLYSVYDLTASESKIQDDSLPITPGTGRLIDGMRIWFQEDKLDFDQERSTFDTEINNLSAYFGRPQIGTVNIAPIEYKVVFNKLDTNSQGEYIFVADTIGALSNVTAKTVLVPFKVYNVTDTTAITALIGDVKKDGNKTGRWDLGEPIYILTPAPYRKSSNSTTAEFIFDKIDGNLPVSFNGGETFYGYLKYPFDISDIYEFTADGKYGETDIRPEENTTPHSFSLEQNYPNPFNPTTTIRYGLPSESRISLQIYNILGQKIADLVNTEQGAGWHEVTWTATVSSGLYFYRIDAAGTAEPKNHFTQIKKMLLLK